MPVRLVVTKQSGQGEQIQADVCQWNPVTGTIEHESIEEMQGLLDASLTSMDHRMHDMNIRMLEAYGLRQYCQPATWQKIVAVLDIIAGRQDAVTVANRWQSEIEETAELEAGRLAAHATAQQESNDSLECTCHSPISAYDEPVCLYHSEV